MKKVLKINLLLIFALGFIFNANAQKKASDKVFDDTKWTDNLFVGANFGLGYADGWNVEFSPRVGYQLIENRVRAGLGLNYNYISSEFYDVKFSTVGPTAFVHVHLFNNIYLAGEGVVNYGKYTSGTFERKFDETNFLVGGGFGSSFGEGWTYDIQILLVTQFDQNDFAINSIYTSPLLYKVGVFYSF